jgi:hypothetical protein
VATGDPNPIATMIEGVRKRMAEARSFWRTRRAILSGEALWDLNRTDLRKRRFVGPWKFIAMQTAVAGSVSLFVAKLLTLIFPTIAKSPFEGGSLNPAINKLLELLTDWISPFVLPSFFSAAVFLIAWGSLRSKDSCAGNRRRARAAYLYLNGALSFWNQLLLAILFPWLSQGQPREFVMELSPFKSLVVVATLARNAPTVTVLLLFQALYLYQFYLVLFKIPKRLLHVNYPGQVSRPWGRLLLAAVIVAWPPQFIVLLVGAFLAFGAAHAILFIRTSMLGG